MRKKGRIRMLLGVILIVMAGLLLGHNLIEDHLAGSSAKKVVTSLKASTGTKVAKPSLKKTAKVNGTASWKCRRRLTTASLRPGTGWWLATTSPLSLAN